MEKAATRVGREVGARVRTNVVVRSMDLGAHDSVEVVAAGLPF